MSRLQLTESIYRIGCLQFEITYLQELSSSEIQSKFKKNKDQLQLRF